MQKRQHPPILTLLLLLAIPIHSQLCSLGTANTQGDLLHSGTSIISNSYINTPARRQHSFSFTLNFVSQTGIKVAASASSLQVSTAIGMDFAIWGGQGTTLTSGLIILLINQDNSWNSIRVQYLASARTDMFLGSFSAGIYLMQKQAQSNSIVWNQAITGWTASQKTFKVVAQLAGVKTAATNFIISLGAVSFNAVTGTLTTTISLSSTPFIESIVITYIILDQTSTITFSPFSVIGGSSAAYQFIGIDQIASGSTTLSGYAFSTSTSGNGITCVGAGCPANCISLQICQAFSGTLNSNATSCLICGFGATASNGQCITPSNCGNNQYYNGTVCVCFNGYQMVNNICYVSCGLNAVVIASQCSCIPGYTFSPSFNQCIAQNTVTCGANFVVINNKCVCPNGFGMLNNQCILCPANSYIDQSAICTCVPGYSLNPNTTTCQIACFANAYRNSLGQCVCINGFYNQGNICVPQGSCQDGYIWNGTNCTCSQGMVLDTITNNCTYCNTPDRSVTDGKCGCSLSYYPTSTSCSPCIPNSAYNSTAKTCLCITNYAMLNGQCVLNANCPFMSYWNAALQKCICNFTGQYVIDGYCQSCQPYSVYNGLVCVCQSGYYMSNGFCIKNCTANQTWNGQVCQCKQGYYLIGGTCMLCDANSYYSNTLFTCVCNNGYFGTWSQCSQCDASCATCSGPGSNQCLTCRGSATFSNGFCRVVCIPGTYPNSLNQCSSCDSSCYTCSGPGNNLCTSCANGFTLTNAFCIANSSPLPPTPTPSSAISLRGYVLGNNVIYQGVAMNLMPTAILSAGCTICNNLFTVSVTSQFASITTTQQYVSGSQYWFVISFSFATATTVPSFQYSIKINPTHASFFTSADMAQSLTESFTQNQFNSASASTSSATPTIISAPNLKSAGSSSTSNNNGITNSIISSIFSAFKGLNGPSTNLFNGPPTNLLNTTPNAANSSGPTIKRGK